MKRFIAAVLILVFALSCSASNLVFDGAEKARKQGKLLILYFTADWCGWCHKLKGTTLKDKSVAGLMESNAVMVMVNRDKYPKLAEKFGVGGIPCLVFFEWPFIEKDRIVGFRKPEEFKKAFLDIRNGIDTFQALKDRALKPGMNADSLLALSEKYLERNMLDEARAHFRLAEKAGASKSLVFYGLGKVEMSAKNFSSAAELIDDSLRYGGEDPEKLYDLCISHYYGKDFIDCVYACNRLLGAGGEKRENTEPFALYLKGLCFRNLESREDSDRAWDMLKERYPAHRYATQVENSRAREEAGE